MRYVIALSDDLLEDLLDEGEFEPVDETVEDIAALPGAVQQEYRKDGYTGSAVTVSFDDVSALFDEQGVVLENLFDRFSITTRDGGWHLSAVVSPTEDDGLIDDPVLRQALKSGSYVVNLSLPGALEEHNADRVDDGTLVWEMDLLLAEPRELTARSVADDRWPVHPLLIIGASVLAIALTLLVAYLTRRKQA